LEKEMNILYCEQLNPGSLGTDSVHIYEIVTNLSKLGHNVVLMNSKHPEVEPSLNIGRRSLWNRIAPIITQFPLVRPFRGELSIMWAFLREAYSFSKAQGQV
jgi:hypothetical protein